LKGAYTTVAHPELSWQGLLENTYQPNLERYLEDQLGFRSSLIRLRNQLSFSLLGVARSTELVIGRDDVLFQSYVVDGYLGRNYLGSKELAFRARRLKIVQEDLAKRHIPLLLLLAPGKARYEPEYLPLQFRLAKHDTSNYEVYIRQCQQAGINVLDANALFLRWKPTTPYPLFPRGGTHWSAYGAARVADTLFRRMEAMAQLDLPDFRTLGEPAPEPASLVDLEEDLSNALNLLYPYQPYPLAYPTIQFDSLKPAQTRPNLLVVGDSFTWSLVNYFPFWETLFNEQTRFWYYNNSVFTLKKPPVKEEKEVHDLDFKQEIESRNFILMITTEHNLEKRDYGFVDQLYELYHPLTDAENARIKEIEKQLLRVPGMEERLWQEAYNSGRGGELLYGKAREIYDRTERGLDLMPLLSM